MPNEEGKIEIIKEFKLNENSFIRLSKLTFDNNIFIDIRRISVKVNNNGERKEYIKKGISIPLEYFKLFMIGLNNIVDKAIENGSIDEMFFIDVGNDPLNYLGLKN